MRWRALGAAVLVVLTAAGSPLAEAREAAAAPAGYTVSGIDVSSWQGTVDWSAVAASGEDFAYAKVSEGMTYANSFYAGSRSGAMGAGMAFGGYHFGLPDEGNPRGQADRLIDLGGYAGTVGRTAAGPSVAAGLLPPMLDMEWNPYGDACYGLKPAELVAWIAAFTDEVRVRTGRRTMIYTNPYWWNPCTGNDATFGANPLFVPRYDTTPPPPTEMAAGWTQWTLWQYTQTGSVPGVNGNVDRNVFWGGQADLAFLARDRITPSPAGDRTPIAPGGDCTATPRPSWCPAG